MDTLKETAMGLVGPHGQDHILEKWDLLNQQERTELVKTLQSLNFAELNEIFKTSTSSEGDVHLQLEPAREVNQIKDRTDAQISHWRNIGLELITQNKVAVVILAGGQGTRLGINKPKGCFEVGLPSKKSLFQIHCERIHSVQNLSNKAHPEGGTQGLIRLLVMTSIHTHEATIEFFKLHEFFGLQSSQVDFFQQTSIPSFTPDGKIIMETDSKIAISPDGNGGIYGALERSGALEVMSKAGVECVDCFSVDNLLAKAADPVFLGYCHESCLPCGARVVAKGYPEEKVGVFVVSNGKHRVVEYSELPLKSAQARIPNSNQLVFNWGNICMHYFTLPFLNKAAKDLSLQYHVAKKHIQSQGSSVEGIKLEKFIFDVFPLAEGVALMEVDRDEEHAPIKNAPGEIRDSPDTAMEALFTLHRKWIEKAGGLVDDHTQIEISPLVSYAGEGLTELCQGRDFRKQRFHLV